MQLIAIVVLLWQRRRVAAALRRGWAWTKRTAEEAPAAGRRARATRVAREAVWRGWRTVDTTANAERVSRFVAWMRARATAGVVARRVPPTEQAA